MTYTDPASSEAIVDLDAFDANLRHLREEVSPAELMVVLKADAYGHGLVPMGLAAVGAGVRRLGALDLDSALALRAAGVPDDVTVFAWLFGPNTDFSAAIRANVDLGISRLSELQGIERADAGRRVRVHLKIDTGLNRNGATRAEWPGLVAAALELQQRGLVEVYGVWTHIAEASEDEDTVAMERFERAVAEAEALGATITVRHLAASSAGLRRDDARFDMVRMGGHCWGIPSFDGVTAEDIGLRQVMTLQTGVALLRDNDHGGRAAMLPLGYADGLPTNIRGAVSVTINGRRYPLTDEIGLDSVMVDVGSGPVAIGDRAIFFGPGDSGEQSVREWGDATGTLGDEIVTRVAPSVPRRYVRG